MKKIFSALSICFVLFTMTLAACDSATSETNSGSPDVPNSCNNGQCEDGLVSHDDYNNTNGETGVLGYCGDNVCGIYEDDTPENCLSCADDCPCFNGLVCNDVGTCESDPLADYYWLEGQWMEENIKIIVDVTIKNWGDELGAEVWGFDPAGMLYAIKNIDTALYELQRTFPSGTLAKGTADPSTLIVEFSMNWDDGETTNSKFQKL
jgi:hypothetical protein